MTVSRRRLLVGAAQGITAMSLSAALTGCTFPWEVKGAPDRGPTGHGDDPGSVSIYDTRALHSFSVGLDDHEFKDMLKTYLETEDKDWIQADITIDGRTFADAGMRLKGNSSLQGVSTDSDPSDLPWLISLDEFKDGQSLDGYTDFVVRSSTTRTALNEAVALDLLNKSGLASQQAIAVRFSTHGGPKQLRLVVQSLDDVWDAEHFTNPGILYKAESGGSYEYRGDDPESYADIFDQETDKDFPNLAPLIDFLKFLNQSSDAQFRSELDQHLEVKAFATYLAFEDLINNFDDIDGLGNNSYLRYDQKTGRMTIVAWDHNLAFVSPGFIGQAPGEPGGDDLSTDDLSGDDSSGNELSADEPYNVLASRFKAEPLFARLYERQIARLRRSLYDSGVAQELLQARAALLTKQANDLVDAGVVKAEADTISSHFDGGAE